MSSTFDIINAEAAAEAAADKSVQWSGNAYVAAMLRENIGRHPMRDHLVRIPLAQPDRCAHGITICPTWDCVESWSIDYRLLLHRTGGGRNLAEQVRWPAEDDIPADQGRVPAPTAREETTTTTR